MAAIVAILCVIFVQRGQAIRTGLGVHVDMWLFAFGHFNGYDSCRNGDDPVTEYHDDAGQKLTEG